MRRIAIIPARGGSKRLPRKNVLPVQGRPMLSYPIKCALASRMFDRVIVSTEDEEIEKAGLDAGAEVMRRPQELAQDRSTVVQVCKHVLDELDRLPEFFCCLYATAIFLTPEDIKNSFELFFSDPKPDVVMGVSEFNLHPVQALEENNGYLSPKWPEYLGIQSQFQPRLVASNGTLYWVQTSYFGKNPNLYCDKLKGYLLPKFQAIDIDTQEDLNFARNMASAAGMGGDI